MTKFIHIPGEKSVDLIKTSYIYSGTYNSMPTIGFNLNDGVQPLWVFKTNEERDDILEKVYAAAGSQDVSKIITSL